MEEKFKEDHREEIEAFERYQEEQAAKEKEEYGEEEDEEDADAAVQEPPVLPEFSPAEY